MYYYGARYLDAQLGRFLSIDPIAEDFVHVTPYNYAENNPTSGIDLWGLQYLDANEARIIMRGSEVHLNLENCNSITRGLWKRRNETGHWPAGNIGYPTQVALLSHPTLPASPEAANLDNTYGAIDPTYNSSQHRVQNPKTKQSNYTKTDRRYKQRSIAGARPGMAKSAAGIIAVINAINWGLEVYGSFKLAEDRQLVSEHLSILQNKVIMDLNRALELNMIPEQYQNLQDMGNIANVILSGVNPTNNQDIYDIGIDIVKQISGNYQQKYKIVYPGAQEGQDNIRPQPILVPINE